MASRMRHHTSALLSVSISAAIAAMIFLGFFGPEGLIMKWEGLWKLAVVVPAALLVNHAAERFLRTQFGARGHELAEEISSAIGGTAGKVKITILFAIGLELLSVMCEGPTNVVGLIAGIALPFCATAGWLTAVGRPAPSRAVLGLIGGLAGSIITVYLTSSFYCMHGAGEGTHFRLACLWLAGPRVPAPELWWLVVYGGAVGLTGSFGIGSSRERPARTTVKWLIVTWIALVAVHNFVIYATAPDSATSSGDIPIPAYIIPVEIALLAQLVGWSIAIVADGNVGRALWPSTMHRWRAARPVPQEAAVLA